MKKRQTMAVVNITETSETVFEHQQLANSN